MSVMEAFALWLGSLAIFAGLLGRILNSIDRAEQSRTEHHQPAQG